MHSLPTLSQELLDQICQSLSTPDIIHVALTCHRLYLSLSRSNCWQKVNLNIHHFRLTNPSKLHEQQTAIESRINQAFQSGLLADSANQINELSFNNTEVTADCLELVFKKCSQLNQLSLLNCNRLDIITLVSLFQRFLGTNRPPFGNFQTLNLFGHPTEAEFRKRYCGVVSWLLPALRNTLVRLTCNPKFHIDILAKKHSELPVYCRTCGRGRCFDCSPGGIVRKQWCERCRKDEYICADCFPIFGTHFYCTEDVQITQPPTPLSLQSCT
ncbi:hypothetical protein K493DRAFT_407402 [Basidiobolus meristosporus CBS 931.73]|uniref:F-box domain-containing protein n=1 Tax=Basidiobolus meristosporus CBS 931.73 TaxID=1314790 RepID=A0A1Y1YD92_9FUNG|nr:hypothetical protein K493DRAFT_407402 [Basidiobolus meristosporus CBS 931.73]|eukprot:ORX96001.1 hypothetical protein K493DRAFT_407402 [Basidiobolus meristosporus CBS 931.73]